MTPKNFLTGLFVTLFSPMTLGEGVAPANHRVVELDSPAPVSSQLSRVTRDESGEIYLSWVSDVDSHTRLSYSRLSKDLWSPAQTISEGADWFLNWADFPMLSVSQGGMVAHWLLRSGADTYDYDIAASFFDESTENWLAAQLINTDGVQAEHGFVSMTPTGNQSTLLTWLDGRNTRRQPVPGAMTLRAAVFDMKGRNLGEWELDETVCDCCQTSSAMAETGPVVVYRNRTEDEVRDISIVRFVDGRWSAPQVVHHDDWQVHGCPVNGPAVAAQGERLAVAWFTAKDDYPKVQLAFSTDSGLSFSAPILVAGTNTNGRVDTVFLSNGQVVVSWMDTQGADVKVMLSRYSESGELLDTTEVASTSASRRSGFPVIENVGNTVYVTWTDVSSEAQVRVAQVAF
ncbi:hypothetical protein [Congregibacter sp.]|uniref:hypothetical protein n=1 Tax=Congregibacter sp. TaxID=2744308 RepID=UPI003F6B405C